MFKVFFLIHRNPRLSRQAFLQHWREVHGPLLLATPEASRHFLRYAQNWPVDGGGRNFEYDGVAVTWLGALDDLAQASAERAFEPLWHDGTSFLDRSRSTVVAMRPQGSEPQAGGQAKVMMFLRRRADLEIAEFQERIADIAAAALASETYVLNLQDILSTTRFGKGELAAIVEISCRDLDAAVAYASVQAERVVEGPLADIIDAPGSSWAVLEERVVHPPA